MRYAMSKVCILAAVLLGAQAAPVWANPLFLPKAETGPPLLSAAELDGFRKEAELLRRKADLLKTAANKKYTAAAELRKKAGGVRTESSKSGEALRSKAEQSAAMSSLIGDMFGIISSVGGMGNVSSNSMVTSALTGQMVQGMQSADAKAVMYAQSASGQLAADAEKKAGPLEMRADELENEGNRLMEANNRLVGIANAKSLLVASDELLKKIGADRGELERLKESNREFAASLTGR